MKEVVLLLCMLFCHIVDDYYLQGWLASAKQKSWWEKNASNPLYKNDYIMALFEHAFSWACMVYVPLVIYIMTIDTNINVLCFIGIFIANWMIHAMTDNAKANLMKINLIQDQLVHIGQILITWLFFTLIA